MTQSYLEHSPRAELARAVRAVWIQRAGETPYVQRHLPTGGVELHFPIGGTPQFLGPLTGPNVEVIPAHTTVVGLRFHPGGAPPIPEVLDDLVDQRVSLEAVWGSTARRLSDVATVAPSPEAALACLQSELVEVLPTPGGADPLVQEAVRRLMPWHPVEVGTLAEHLAISSTQLRRRCLHRVGISPKALQRTLRFQGFLALAQAGTTTTHRRSADGLAALAFGVGYADHAHLSRECVRVTGLTPRELLGQRSDRCACGHDHAAS
ncbi:MAG TPA: helix-turn-helix domain-containing protein [Nocardioidaceae bacterium]|nr:helix-turn-helix domain-containing protein [Nocardioidaceae bacterium]